MTEKNFRAKDIKELINGPKRPNDENNSNALDSSVKAVKDKSKFNEENPGRASVLPARVLVSEPKTAIPRWVFEPGVNGHIRSPTDLEIVQSDLQSKCESMKIGVADVEKTIVCQSTENKSSGATIHRFDGSPVSKGNHDDMINEINDKNKAQVPLSYDSLSNAQSENDEDVRSSSQPASSEKKNTKVVLGHCLFKPTSLWSLDSQIYKNYNTNKLKDMLSMAKGPRAKPKSILKPFSAESLYVYHYAPLSKDDAYAHHRDPRAIIPRSAKETDIPSMALMLAPELFQQPWTLTQLLYALRSPVDAPLAWLAAVLDIYTHPGAMEIDRITRLNAYGPKGMPGFAISDETTVVDSALGLDKDGSMTALSPSCPVSLLGVVRNESPRRVHFAPSVVTSVAFIEPKNAGKSVKKRSSRKYPVVYALPGTKSVSNNAKLYTTPLVKCVELPKGPDKLMTETANCEEEEEKRNEPNIDVRIDMNALNGHGNRLRVWSIISPAPSSPLAYNERKTPIISHPDHNEDDIMSVTSSKDSVSPTTFSPTSSPDFSSTRPSNNGVLTRIQSIGLWLLSS